MRPERIVILGAAGRDFHNFNVVYRQNAAVRVVAFTAAQIPGIAERRYPSALAGPHYPAGIPIEAEDALEDICRRDRVTLVVFAYSDVSHAHVMRLASRVLALGADFALLGPERTMLTAAVPVVAVSAVRTGCPGEAVLRMADVVVVNKVDTASAGAVAHAVEAVRAVNSTAPIVRGRGWMSFSALVVLNAAVVAVAVLAIRTVPAALLDRREAA